MSDVQIVRYKIKVEIENVKQCILKGYAKATKDLTCRKFQRYVCYLIHLWSLKDQTTVRVLDALRCVRLCSHIA